VLPRPAILKTLVGDLRQVASVRRFALQDGAEAGLETLAFSTGGGLDFWVTAGRMMDIATLSWRGVQLGWQSPAGFRRPSVPTAAGKRSFNQGFGGFLNTCGFDHIRQPADGRPLHGSVHFTPARLTAYGEDWGADEPVLYCEGEAVCWAYGAGGHRLKRRIETPIGGASVRIRDHVDVIGPDPAPILALYHFNLGYPVVGDGTAIRFDGKSIVGPLSPPEAQLVDASVHPTLADWATCTVSGAGPAWIDFRWRTDTLPFLQLWRDLRPRSGVLSIEPCSIGRKDDGSNAPSDPVRPGEERIFEIELMFADSTSEATRS